MPHKNLKIAYFGGEPIGVPVLAELAKADIVPNIIICNPDRPAGRKQLLTAPKVKEWALEHDIPVFQPESLKDADSIQKALEGIDLFVVVAYNKIMPKWLVEMPVHKTINVHPSLLPKLRGASPIRTAILQDMRETGVTIMLMDEKMDHGPILAQEIYEIAENEWPLRGTELDSKLANFGGKLLASTIPKWIAGTISPRDQDHEAATHCGKITKEMAELHLDPLNLPSGNDAYQALLKIRAFDGWPTVFFIHAGKRVKIIDADIDKDGTLEIKSVIPEGKKVCDFATYLPNIS